MSGFFEGWALYKARGDGSEAAGSRKTTKEGRFQDVQVVP